MEMRRGKREVSPGGMLQSKERREEDRGSREKVREGGRRSLRTIQ